MCSVGEPSWSRLSRGAFLRPQREGLSPASSIVTMYVSPSVVCARLITNSSGSLGKHARASDDPDLQGLARERWRGTGPRPTVKRRLLINRSAGACPPRAYDMRENRTPAKAISRANRGTARDRPAPYGEGMAFFSIARGPVPRERWSARTMARDRPAPYVKREAFFHRSTGHVTATLSEL